MKKALFISVVLVSIFAFSCSTSSTEKSKTDSISKVDTLKTTVDSLTVK